MIQEGPAYLVEPAKPWHKTRLTAEQWFLKNPPHLWHTLDDAIGHYTDSGFELVDRSSQFESEIPQFGVDFSQFGVDFPSEEYAVLRANTRYSWRHVLFWMCVWCIPTFGTAATIQVWYFLWRRFSEQMPEIIIGANPDGSGVYFEERNKGNAGLNTPMVHPVTGQTGWHGCPDDYYPKVMNTWQENLERLADEQQNQP